MTAPKTSTDEVERAILSALLNDPEALGDLSEQLSEDEFTEGPRRMTYEAMLTLHRAGDPVDLVTVTAELKRMLPGAPVAVAVAKLTSEPGSPSHLYHYAAKLRAERTLQRMRASMSEAIDDLSECRADPEAVSDLLTDITLRIENHAIRIERSQEFNLAREMAAAFEDMRKTDEPPGIESGFHEMDALTHGLMPGKLIVVGGRPSMGKSALALTIARNIGKDGKRSLFFSMEMPRNEIVQRMLAAEADVDLTSIITRRLSQDDLLDITKAIASTRDLPIMLCDEPSVGVPYIRAALRRALKAGPVDCIFIDYLQIMSSGRKAEQRHLEIGEYSRELKRVAMEFKIPVIAMAQLSRDIESRTGHTPPCYPRLSDLRESGSIEQDADVVMFLWRGHVYAAEGCREDECEVIVAKNRGGRCGTFKLHWQGDRTRFTNPAPVLVREEIPGVMPSKATQGDFLG